jgi:deazaflavin-dependent oxidoreductase (nitroreductase family)
MPSGLANFFVKALLNSPLHAILGGNIAVITVHGRKTGRAYSTPVNVVCEGDTFTVVSRRSRTWWRNLRGGGAAELRVSGKRLTTQGEVIEGHEEVVEGLLRYFERNSRYAEYFQVHLTGGGQPERQDIERVARERVIILLRPVVRK